jgi:hypothetical protein
MRFTQTQTPIMKKKCSTKPVRRSLGKGGFINLRTLFGLTLGLSGIALAIFAGKEGAVRRASEPERYMPVPGGKSGDEARGLAELEQYWHNRLTFPTGRFDPAWVRAAAAQHARMTSGVPAGQHLKQSRQSKRAEWTDLRARSATGADDRLFRMF